MENQSLEELSQSQIKEELADKVLRGKKLNTSEKESIYCYLTGKEPLYKRKRGRPSTKVRDYHLALAYLSVISDDPQTSHFHLHRKNIVKEYGIHNLPKAENTFYSALTRGIEILETRARNCIERVNSNIDLDVSDEIKQESKLSALNHLKLIDDYRKRNQHLKK